MSIKNLVLKIGWVSFLMYFLLSCFIGLIVGLPILFFTIFHGSLENAPTLDTLLGRVELLGMLLFSIYVTSVIIFSLVVWVKKLGGKIEYVSDGKFPYRLILYGCWYLFVGLFLYIFGYKYHLFPTSNFVKMILMNLFLLTILMGGILYIILGNKLRKLPKKSKDTIIPLVVNVIHYTWYMCFLSYFLLIFMFPLDYKNVSYYFTLVTSILLHRHYLLMKRIDVYVAKHTKASS